MKPNTNKQSRKFSLDSTQIEEKSDTSRLVKSSVVKARKFSLVDNKLKSKSADEKARRPIMILEYDSDAIESEIVTYATEDEGFSTEDTNRNFSDEALQKEIGFLQENAKFADISENE